MTLTFVSMSFEFEEALSGLFRHKCIKLIRLHSLNVCVITREKAGKRFPPQKIAVLVA